MCVWCVFCLSLARALDPRPPRPCMCNCTRGKPTLGRVRVVRSVCRCRVFLFNYIWHSGSAQVRTLTQFIEIIV